MDNDEKDGGEDNNISQNDDCNKEIFRGKEESSKGRRWSIQRSNRLRIRSVSVSDHFEVKFRDVEDPQYDQNQLEVFNALIKFPVKSPG